jgi:hypothetical protein
MRSPTGGGVTVRWFLSVLLLVACVAVVIGVGHLLYGWLFHRFMPAWLYWAGVALNVVLTLLFLGTQGDDKGQGQT